MTDSGDLKRHIRAIFVEKLNVEVSADDANLLEAGLLDSLAFVDLLLHLEQDLGVKVSVQDLDIGDFSSIDRIAGFVAARSDRAGP